MDLGRLAIGFVCGVVFYWLMVFLFKYVEKRKEK